MIPQVGDEVKIFFKNSLQVEGRVKLWKKKKIILSSENDDHIMVVNDTKNILMYKISKVKEKEIKEVESAQEEATLIEENFKSDFNPNPNIYTLAHLHKLKLDEEKKAIAQKIKQHQISEIKQVEYGLPGFFKKQESE
jgi:sRNA-binding regulator protein Hfq